MQKSLMFVLVATTSFLMAGGSTSCLAAEPTGAGSVTDSKAAIAQPSHREMQKARRSHGKDRTQGKRAGAQSGAAPAPSNRGMRRQMREASRNQAGDGGKR